MFTDSGGGSKLSWMADRLILYTHMYIVVNCVILSEFLTRIIKSTTNVMCTFAAAWGHLYVFLLLQWPEMTALHTPVSAQNLGAPPPSCSSWSFTVRSLEEGSHQVHTCYLLTTSHSNVLCAYACPQTHHMHAQTCAHTYTHIHTKTHATHVHRHVHTLTQTHTYMHTCTRAHTCTLNNLEYKQRDKEGEIKEENESLGVKNRKFGIRQAQRRSTRKRERKTKRKWWLGMFQIQRRKKQLSD